MNSISEIKEQILAEKAKYMELDAQSSPSKVAIYNLWAYVVATVAWIQYQLWEVLQEELNVLIREQKLYTLYWWQQTALAFRFGHPLDEATGSYLGDGYTDEEIASAQIVSRAAVIELEVNNRKHLFIKVAKSDNDTLVPLSDTELDALEQYFATIKPAGTKIVLFTGPADQLRLTLDYYYDPLLLTEGGARIDGSSNSPVQDAIREYLQVLKFNGEFTISDLEDTLQQLPSCAEGEVYVRAAEANYKTPAAWESINDSYVANSGYMEILDENLTINFIPKTVVL